ncbi:hypothetical protein [Streptomyces sp. NPDC089919]|uniref:hypothetical protein n=1 Tax=Streptomyces sp. NPDC089919 TaxID=3155188 RepID=UPI0034259C76
MNPAPADAGSGRVEARQVLDIGDAPGGQTETGHHAVGGWQAKDLVHLGDGWTASIDFNASARTARADIARHGAVKANLKANGHIATVKLGTTTFTLTPGGMVYKTTAAASTSPLPGGWQSKGVTSLGGGWTAKVSVNASSQTVRAEIARGPVFKGTLEAHGKSASTTIDGRTFVLSTTGTVSKASAS